MTAAFDYRGAREAVFDSDLPGPLRLVVLAVIESMPNAEPSVALLAKRCGVERKTVLRAIARLELTAVLAVDRSNGRRSRYVLRDPSEWRSFPPRSTPQAVPHIGTGDDSVPVPESHGTGPNDGTGPVPTAPQTGPILVPKAVEKAVHVSGSPERAREGWALTMPSEEPTKSYLDAALMAGVGPEQARSTWSHYFGAGLPSGGVERLEPWLVQRAVERKKATARLPSKASAFRAAAPTVEPKRKHVNYARHYGLDLVAIVADLHERKIVETLGTDAFHEHLERALVAARKAKEAS